MKTASTGMLNTCLLYTSYSRPRNSFVAEFLGASNVITAKTLEDESGLYTLLGGTRLPVPDDKKEGDAVSVIFRADEVELSTEIPAGTEDRYVLRGTLHDQMYPVSYTHLDVYKRQVMVTWS